MSLGQQLRRQRQASVAAGLLVAVVALGAGGVLWTGGDDDGSSLTISTDDEEQPLEQPQGARRGLPIGDGKSTYWVAHVLPRGYRIVSADEKQDPIQGRLSAHETSYQHAGGDDARAALRVTTIEGDAVAGTSLAEDAPPGGVEKVKVRGRDGLRFPMGTDGQAHGTSLLWEQRPGLWILVEAAEPLTAADAASVAEGLQPYPAHEWTDLQAGVDIVGSIEPGSTEGFTTVSLGSGTVNGAMWALDALIPPRYGELPADRRTSCARLSVDAVALAEIACLSAPSWIAAGGQVFLIGLAPPEARSVTVRTATSSVTAELFSAEHGPDVQYWVATLGSVECQEAQVSFSPEGLDDEITGHMGGAIGPGSGCGGPPPGGLLVPPTTAGGPSPGG